jgi:hypothetical protein
MKKMIVIILSVILVLGMTACGNMSLGPGNYSFKKIHVDTYHYHGCFTVEKWYDNSTGIEVKTKEVGPLYLSEGQYMMISDECPFCNCESDKKDEAANGEDDSVPIEEVVENIGNRLEEIENRVDTIENGADG